MSVLFAGTELEAFNNLGAPAVSEVALAGAYDPAVVRCAILFDNGQSTDCIETLAVGGQATAWLHFEFWSPQTGATSGFTMAEWRNTAGTAVFRLQFTASGTVQPQYWTGAAWTNIGATHVQTVGNGLYVYDLKVVAGAAGSFELYRGGSLVSSGAGLNAAVTNLDKARLYNTRSATSTNRTGYSQIIIADENTVGWKYYTKPPTGNGANASWVNDYQAVDELTLSTADYIEANAAGDVETYTGAAIALPAATVKAVVVSAQAKQVAGGPQNIQAALRRGGVNYFSANLVGLGAGFAPVQGIFANDPSTGTVWTAANAGAAATEFGVKAIA